MRDLAFTVATATSVLFALLVVTRRNPIYSAAFLAAFFLSVSVIFFALEARFLAMMQLMVYAGAIMVLFIFVIMLLSLRPEEMGQERGPAGKAMALLSAAAVCALLFTVFGQAEMRQIPALAATNVPEGFGQPATVGRALFEQFAFPFEMISVLILAALFGAVAMAKRLPAKAPVQTQSGSAEADLAAKGQPEQQAGRYPE